MRCLSLVVFLSLGLCACGGSRERPLPPEEPFATRLDKAEAALSRRQPIQALRVLGVRPSADLPIPLQSRWLDLEAESRTQAGQWLAAIRSRFALVALPQTVVSEQDNHWRLFELLRKLPGDTLYAEQAAAAPDVRPWYHLAILDSSLSGRAVALSQALEAWQEANPDHPAGRHVLPMLMAAVATQAKPLQHIALLLPFSGTFAQAGQAVLRGFLSAWYVTDRKARLSLYDTQAGELSELLQQLAESEADIVVGPLSKSTLASLLALELPERPMLTLNYLDTLPDSAPKALVQFGLAPEDEARQVAERAWFDGHSAALILATDDAFGTRVARAFSSHWLRLGGMILEQQHYSPNAQDYSRPVKMLINVDEHEMRRYALQALLSEQVYSRHPGRKDADFIFLVARPEQGRQIMPQLRYFSSQRMPVYSTSHVYGGVEDRRMNADLDGLRFVDMPWVVDRQRRYSVLQTQLQRLWSNHYASMRRLYAMGVDACRVLPLLPRLFQQSEYSYQGETGTLSIQKAGRLHRHGMHWAEFRDGVANASAMGR